MKSWVSDDLSKTISWLENQEEKVSALTFVFDCWKNLAATRHALHVVFSFVFKFLRFLLLDGPQAFSYPLRVIKRQTHVSIMLITESLNFFSTLLAQHNFIVAFTA